MPCSCQIFTFRITVALETPEILANSPEQARLNEARRSYFRQKRIGLHTETLTNRPDRPSGALVTKSGPFAGSPERSR